MTTTITELRVPETASLDDIKARLAGHYGLKQEAERLITRVYLDSFDWRIYKARGILAMVQDGDLLELSFTDRHGGELVARQRIQALPRHLQDIPPGPVRDLIAPTLSIRVLLPIVQVESRHSQVRVLDDETKTVVRIEMDRNRYSTPDGGLSGELAPRLRLTPVRGYDADYQVVRDALGNFYDSAGPSVLDTALQAIGRAPGDYNSNLNYRLDPKSRSDEATKEIQLGLLRTLEANIEGTKGNWDSEFLHDLRVAVRRTRSALTQIKDVFAPEVTGHYTEGFAWLQEITGPVRDLDVYLLALDDYRRDLPVFLRNDLGALRTFLESHYAQEQRELVRHLESVQFVQLLKSWRSFLETPVPDQSLAANGRRPVKDLADERIWKMYRRVIDEGRAINDLSAPEELHEMRKSCKKLRYLLEFFASLYPEKKVTALVKIMKTLLDNLGAFQDLEVQAHTLQHFAEQMVSEGLRNTNAVLAMGSLIGCLIRHQNTERMHFAQIFSEFDTKEHDALFRSLFREQGA